MLKERTTYEIMNPQDVGWEGTKLVLGKHSGRAGFRNTLNELGIKLDDDQLNEAYQRFLDLADRKKRVTAADVIALVQHQLQTAGDTYHLLQWRVDLASGEPASASVMLAHGEYRIAGDADGNGPIDALLKAIDAATGVKTVLEYYHVEAVTPGEDAQGQVHVRVRSEDGQLYTGHGLATDIVEASARAYLDALSKMELDQPTTLIAGSAVSRWT
jgi:2-isopropylmalate synthase